uniref:U4-buthitoxin-Hj1a n=1 Tax=Hottentotta judaicus TaxID=6863 RepID=F1CJ99_HOTJU|nr:U4-buthitoxin-Hj1a [Hottentotta judaicus]
MKMNYIILVACLFLIPSGKALKDDYPVEPHNCLYWCFRDTYCNDDLCPKLKGTGGWCDISLIHGNGCFCYKLPDNTPVKIFNQKCKKP